jgi:hypothetical protein
MDIADAALTASFTLSSKRIILTLSAERLIFLGTASSFIMRSKPSTHCLRTFSAVVESPPLFSGKRLMTVCFSIGYAVMVVLFYLNICGILVIGRG